MKTHFKPKTGKKTYLAIALKNAFAKISIHMKQLRELKNEITVRNPPKKVNNKNHNYPTAWPTAGGGKTTA